MPARKFMPRVCHICGDDYLPKSGNQRFCNNCRVEIAVAKTVNYKSGPYNLGIKESIRLVSKIAQERIKSGLNYVEDINDISWAQ